MPGRWKSGKDWSWEQMIYLAKPFAMCELVASPPSWVVSTS